MLKSKTYKIEEPWTKLRPHILVVTCSDGRIQAPVDEFLHEKLGYSCYDRLYLPGGPGAFMDHSLGEAKSNRAEQQLSELRFLIEAHQIERVILMFHGPSENGPEDSICADYRRLYPTYSLQNIREQQEADSLTITAEFANIYPKVVVQSCRLEVLPDSKVEIKLLNVH